MKADPTARIVGVVIGGLVGWQIGAVAGSAGHQLRHAIAGILVGGIVGLIVAPLAIFNPYRWLRHRVSTMPPGDLAWATLGLVIGLLIAALLSYPLSFLPWWFGHILPAVAALAGGYVGVALLMMRRTELSLWAQHHLHGRPAAVAAPADGPSYLLDTSAIIDGRIADICRAGFLPGHLLVPQFVLSELQHIAGSSDPLRRTRGRRGLEILNQVQQESASPLTVCDMDAKDVSEVDAKLVHLARELGCPVVTNDFNLNRVAALQGVRVLNINRLATAVRPVVLPGEQMDVRIIQEGREPLQGVGYLDDGTMIVVENGRSHLHSDMEVIVTRVLQTSAGRMIFAHPKGNGHG